MLNRSKGSRAEKPCGTPDNTGVTSILAGTAPTEAPNGYYLIASDAGGVPKQLSSPPRGRLHKLRYVMRQFDMRGRPRVGQRPLPYDRGAVFGLESQRDGSRNRS